MKSQHLFMLVILAALWGGSFLYIRIASPALGPAVVANVRVALAGAGLLAYAAAIHRVPADNLRRHWKEYLVIGALNAAVPYTLIGMATLHLTASLASILNATTPLFSAIVSALVLHDRLTWSKMLGLALGLAGVAVLAGWSPIPLTTAVALGACASLGAALSYAIATVYCKVKMGNMPPLALAIGQQLGAAVVMLPFTVPVALRTTMHITPVVIAAMLALAFVSTSLAYLIYFRLLVDVGPTRTLSVTFMVPWFGTFWSVLLLHEPLNAGMFAGMALILSSIFLVTGTRLALPARHPAPHQVR